MKAALLLVALFSIDSLVFAEEEFRFAGIFTDHVVLQRDQDVPVWGFARAGAKVEVTFEDQVAKATADENGRWQVVLKSLPASAEGQLLRAALGEWSIELDDVLVGDVWLCSGQSNMAMIVDRSKNPEKEKADAELPGVRVFKVDRKASRELVNDVGGEWVVSSPETAGRFSATAFFFGREIHREAGVPVGLIVSAWSGSAIEAWTSREVQEDVAELKPLLESWKKKADAYTPEIRKQKEKEYEAALVKWRPLRDAAVENGTAKPRPPRRPLDPGLHHHHPYVLFNGMIHPLMPYALKGAIWYQGETNGLTPEAASLYETQLPLMVKDWRARWGQGDFPMAWIQLPPASARQTAWAPVREAMRLAQQNLPNAGMAITMDFGEERILHPLNKQAFAHRLALWARSEVYGEEGLASSGPLPDSHRVAKGRVVVSFDHAHDGLIAKGGDSLVGFELMSADGEWVTANAKILPPASVIISRASMGSPVAVRYAWGNDPEANLINGAGLPASPFQLEIANESSPAAPAAKRGNTPPPTKPPLEPVDVSVLPYGMESLDIYLLMGQSNMKGRGVMPEVPLRDPVIVMMHKKTDEWFIARHPLHLVGDPRTFQGHDNAGVGPGLAFGRAMAKENPAVRIGLVPCAVGGSHIALWQPGAKLYEDAVRRAKLAVESGPKGKTRIAGAIWLQGESDANNERINLYKESLHKMIEGLRKELNESELPFVVTTILELRPDVELRKSINEKLMALPDEIPHTGAVDGRDLTGHIGDMVHIDTPGQNEIGRRFAKLMIKLKE